jgi:hypothetical protein
MDPNQATDFYNSLTNPANAPPIQDPQATLQAALSAPPPQPAQMPQRQTPDTSAIPGLALLRLAATLSQRRYGGQSRLGQLTEGLSDAAGYAMNTKKELQDQADKQYSQDVAARQVQSQIGATDANAAATRQTSAIQAAGAPLNLEGLRQSIITSRDEDSLKKIQIRLGAITEHYASAKAQAELDLQTAQTAEARARAQADLSNATANLQTAQAHMQTAQAQMGRLQLERDVFNEGKKAGDFKTQMGLPGDPGTFTYKDSHGGVMVGTMPISQADAIKKAKSDWQLVKDLPENQAMSKDQYIQKRVGELVNPPTWKAAIDDMNMRRNGSAGVGSLGTQPPAVGTSSPTPGAAPSTPAASPGVISSAQQMALDASKTQPGKVFVFNGNGGQPVYYQNGQELSPDQIATLQPRLRPVGASAAPSASPAPAAPPTPTGPEKAPEYTGAYARERQSIHQRMLDLKYQIDSHPDLDVNARAVIANEMQVLQRNLTALNTTARQ